MRIYRNAYYNMYRPLIEYDYLHGMKITEILKKYSMSRKGLYNALHRWEIDFGQRKNNKYNRVITALKYSGKTTKEVSKMYGIPVRTIYYICKCENFNLRWRAMRISPERRAKLLAEGLSWRNRID